MPAVTIRPVSVSETRPLRQAVLRPHETVAELAARERDDAYAVGAYSDAGELVAVGLIMRDGSDGGDAVCADGAWRVRGMATAPQARGRGAGRAVLQALIEHARGEGACRIWCNARTPALNLYRRAGFTIVSDEFELPQIGPHRRMELRLSSG